MRSRGPLVLVLVLVFAVAAAALAAPGMAKKKPKHKPKIGPLEGCVFITNNGNSSTENIEVLDKGAGGMKGTIQFNGDGLDKTSPFTLGSNGMVVVPFTVTQFGSSTITVDLKSIPPMHYSLNFNLGSANDVTQTSCTPEH
jgi:hypothetical protein